jgi:hypothetical protein
MHALFGLFLGLIASLPAGDVVVTLCASALFSVGSAITGFILVQVEKAKECAPDAEVFLVDLGTSSRVARFE